MNIYTSKTEYLEAENKRLYEVNQELLNALQWIADQTYDPWTNGAEAQRHAVTAIAKAQEQK